MMSLNIFVEDYLVAYSFIFHISIALAFFLSTGRLLALLIIHLFDSLTLRLCDSQD